VVLEIGIIKKTVAYAAVFFYTYLKTNR